MSDRSPSPDPEENLLLTEDENEQLKWKGILKQDENNEYPALFVATNRRLIVSLGSGHFRDIGLKHIESVEVSADKKSETQGIDPGGIVVMGALSVGAGIAVILVGEFSGLATLAGLCMCVLGGYGVWYGKENYDQLKDELEVKEYTIYHILLRTTAESTFAKPIYIETEENVGPELSRLVQESQ